jgi:hypothetical protein
MSELRAIGLGAPLRLMQQCAAMRWHGGWGYDTNHDTKEFAVETDFFSQYILGSPCSFDTRPERLRQLQSSGVPEPVILAMLRAS